MQVFKNILTAANQVSRKIQNMQTRLKLLEAQVADQFQRANEESEAQNEEPVEQQIDQIEGTSHAIEILNQLIERAHAHYEQNDRKSGFLMSYQDFLCLSYMRVNQMVL